MKVEYNGETKRTSAKPRKRKKRRLKPAFYIFLAMLVIGTLTALSLTVFFEVGGFELSGSSVYSADEITYTSGLLVGDNLIRINTKKASSAIEQGLPYIKSAVVKRKFPDKVSIEVTPAEEYAVALIADEYFIVDSDFKVLSKTDGKKDGLLYIKCSESVKASPGFELDFTQGNEYDDLKTIMTYTSSKGLSATVIDVTSRVSVSAVLDNRLYVTFGSSVNLERKLEFLSSMMSSVPNDVNASIDLGSWNESNKKATLVYEDISDKLN